eukprot:Tamp_05779.p1 GENE.Tamp_05779~~Tamp_05779.p1  ORF type:complete len:578 (+),score=107.65 Tamp_05779:81-1736(+)
MRSGRGQALVMALGTICAILVLSLRLTSGQSSTQTCKRGLRVATWNVAAINNNPFEYWITYPDAKYVELMQGVQEFVSAPGARDVPVHEVFTDSMAKELFTELASRQIAGLSEVETLWGQQYRGRKIISEFIKDKALGKKRLASMPDRVTNTIQTADGGKALRPTVINCYQDSLPTMDTWWERWKGFMFQTKLPAKGKDTEAKMLQPFEMLQPILQSKYPDITLEEQAVSIPLQTLCMAIFDAILVHMLLHVGRDSWQPIRTNICEALNRHKNDKIKEILKKTYFDSHVIMLQETASAFVADLRNDPEISGKYLVVSPAGASAKRDQNSLILLDKRAFVVSSVTEVTDKILKHDETKAISAPGDVLAITATTSGHQTLLLVSFHGDTNGLATKPLVSAIMQALRSDFSENPPALVLGMDGNTYKKHSDSYQGVEDLQHMLVALGLSSIWGDTPDPLKPTTCNARTYLQPQLNKAVSKEETFTKGDVNLKDWIVFRKGEFASINGTVVRDNQGTGHYTERMVFPTLDFPSDHAVVAATLVEVNESHQCLFHD